MTSLDDNAFFLNDARPIPLATNKHIPNASAISAWQGQRIAMGDELDELLDQVESEFFRNSRQKKQSPPKKEEDTAEL